MIGTSALRRQALINNHFPGLVCKDIRGNVNTRLQKLRDGMYDAIILARTGLERLELTDVISHNLETDKFGTAVGQGALGITCRVGDQKSLELVKKMHHGPTALCIEAEVRRRNVSILQLQRRSIPLMIMFRSSIFRLPLLFLFVFFLRSTLLMLLKRGHCCELWRVDVKFRSL